MLQALTKYLLQNGQVSIPSIGTFTLREVPARYDFGEKLILPPTMQASHVPDDSLSESQLSFLEDEMGGGKEDVQNRLHSFGNGLRSALQQEPFGWNGLGTLELKGSKIVFQQAGGFILEPVAAHKVIREDARHYVRRGEDQVHSSFQQNEEEVAVKKNDLEWLAWLLVVLAILFIIFCFYNQNFSVHATGKQTPALEGWFQK
ncbi:MAG: hypothetical protein JWP88_624 [Flaviaesturariibacter sp.]|nr:hypothetical protein [Flaviaesturariibacter sp.]